MKVKLLILLPLFALTSISAIISTPLVANGNECQSAIYYGKKISKVNNINQGFLLELCSRILRISCWSL